MIHFAAIVKFLKNKLFLILSLSTRDKHVGEGGAVLEKLSVMCNHDNPVSGIYGRHHHTANQWKLYLTKGGPRGEQTTSQA